MVDVTALVPIYGSVSEMARIAGAHRSAVHRWQLGLRPIRPEHQHRLLDWVRKKQLDVEWVADKLDIPQCPYCKRHHIVEGRG
jgi:hypothetical protein